MRKLKGQKKQVKDGKILEGSNVLCSPGGVHPVDVSLVEKDEEHNVIPNKITQYR